jgi:hypothetical protein
MPWAGACAKTGAAPATTATNRPPTRNRRDIDGFRMVHMANTLSSRQGTITVSFG